eukprot:6956601-Pyramimonas_sp.AAC.1
MGRGMPPGGAGVARPVCVCVRVYRSPRGSDQWREGRGHIPVDGTNCVRGGGIYPWIGPSVATDEPLSRRNVWKKRMCIFYIGASEE